MANTITLTNGNDSETGTILDDIIWSLDGDDTVFGGIGRDTIHGGNGSDELWGGSGNDTIYGDNDNDKIDDGAGDDYMIGGNGSDKFLVHAGHDTIADFQDSRDTIDVSETLTTFATRKGYVDSHATVVGGNTILTDDVSTSVTILGLTNITQLYDDIV